MPPEIMFSCTESCKSLDREVAAESSSGENALAPHAKPLNAWLRKRESTLLCILIIVVTLAAAEWIFRALLFSEARFMLPLQKAGLYADCMSSDDYWKLLYLFPRHDEPAGSRYQREGTVSHYDSQLGWVNSLISPETYRHADAAHLGSKTPLLFYGDSFAQCRTPPDECFQGLINGDPHLSSTYRLINYGVWGYGLDQIYLLYRKTIDLYKEPVVIISLLPEDMDRAVLTVRDAPKPYFILNNDKLELKGIPVDPDLNRYHTRHPPHVYSYLASLANNLVLESLAPILPPVLDSYVRPSAQQRSVKEAINRKIVQELSADLKRRGLTFVFLVFDQPEAAFQPLQWRERFLFNLLAEQEIPYISARTVIRQYESEETFSCQTYLFSCHDHHPSSVYNQILTRQLVEWMRVQRLLDDFEGTRAANESARLTRIE